MGKVHSIDPCESTAIDAAEPIQGVTVTSDDGVTEETNSTGGYELEDVRAGTRTITFAETGFLTWITDTIKLDCGEDEVLDAELLCLGDVTLKVVTSVATDTLTSNVVGAEVTYTKPFPAKAAHYRTYYGVNYRDFGVTNPNGELTLTAPIINETGTFTVTAPGIAQTGVFTWTQMAAVGAGPTIFGGLAFNSRVMTIDGPPPTFATQAPWNADFDEHDCYNIGGAYVTLPNNVTELVLCGYGTVAGHVTVSGVNAENQLVRVIMNGVVVGSALTDHFGTYIIEDIATGCFSDADQCKTTGVPFSVRCGGWTQTTGLDWDGCGDVERVDFAF